MRLATLMEPHDGRLLLGLDIGGAAVKAVALARTAQGPCLAAAGEEPVPPVDGDGPEAASAAARTALERLLGRLAIGPERVARVATALGGPEVTVGELELPRMPERELRRAAPWEVRKHLPEEGWVFDLEALGPAPEDPAKVRVRYSGAPQALLDSRLALLHAVGLEAESVEPMATALVRACRGLLADVPPASRLVLDVGHAGTTLVIGSEDGALFARFLQIGIATRAAALVPAGAAEAADAETDAATEPALVRQARDGGELLDELLLELRRSVAFFASRNGGARVARAVLCGGGAAYPTLALALAARLEIPVRPFLYRGNHAVPRLESPWAAAYGLAARLAR